MKILYVEDDSRDADLTMRQLRKTAPHLQMETVSTISQALERLARIAVEPLDLVLLDMHLRDGDGLSLLTHIRENAVPVAAVVITGLGDEETAVAALKARADDYVVKRKDYLDRLPLTLESAFNHYRADAARRAHPLKVLYAECEPGDDEIARRHFAMHADHIQLDVVSTGAEALVRLQPSDGSASYDVLLLDYHLREMDALEALKELRLIHKLDVPVVLLCGQNNEESARQALKLGATSYVVKNPGYLHQLPWELEEAHFRAELLRREAALQESEESLLQALLAGRMIAFEWNVLTDGVKRSTLSGDILGLTEGATQGSGKDYFARLHPEDHEAFTHLITSLTPQRDSYQTEYRMLRPDGTFVWLDERAHAFFDQNGKMLRLVGVAADITERKQAEESLKQAHAEVQQLKDRLHAENIYLQEEIQVARDFGEIIGQSEALKRVLRMAEQVAPLDTTVLILGETGTGKELLAHAIHRLSPRASRPLVKVNCATLPAQLIESELFGHEKGAFTGAAARRTGRFEIAHGGTIFLDEVGELPLDLQSKLLRALQEGEFERLGSSRTIHVDVRVIAATNRSLEDAVREGLFRSDLYYRLSIFPVTLPPLRERQEDIPMLVMHFVNQLSAKLGKAIQTIPQETMAVLQNYPWPGNIRELRNVIERAAIITQGPKLRLLDSLESLPLKVAPPTPAPIQPLTWRTEKVRVETLDESQYNLILRALEKTYWRVEGPEGAAELLGVNANTLRSRMKKLGITKPKFKTPP